ncbi:hypothetical protein DVH24_029941 [Malus domestica]|uniref:Kinesin motor domain-containing protein n=1 Tax=Malus domestica TaxID=3750 RepID=A0A498HWN7_MALDO|nr:hypothetical protein DVH24_029941 [Malus domestica]
MGIGVKILFSSRSGVQDFVLSHEGESFQRLLHKQDGTRAEWEYPFAVAGINISFVLAQMLDLQSGTEMFKFSITQEFRTIMYCLAYIFAYGQTSSGKTYTMRGITEKAVIDIYNHIINTPERDFTIKISGLEIYNENVRECGKVPWLRRWWRKLQAMISI